MSPHETCGNRSTAGKSDSHLVLLRYNNCM